MNSSQNIENDDKKPKTFISLIGIGAGALGGFTGLVLGFGYITITCFLTSVKLYGLAEFPLQFYREASVRFLSETIGFYSSHWYMILLVIGILLIPIVHIVKKRRKENKGSTRYDSLIRYLRILCQIILLLVILLTWSLHKIKINTGSTIKFNALMFFAISIPVLVALFLYLLFNYKYKEFDYKRPHRTPYGIFFLSFILLFISIPVGYGSSIYDIYLYEVDVPECDEVDVFREPSAEGIDLLYLMGHTSGREIFSYVTDIPPRLILVNKESIKSISVKYKPNPEMSIRKLFSRLPISELKPKETKEVTKEEEEEWYKQEKK